MKNKKIIIGLTGGVATGKSTVAKMFRRLGVRTLDTDKISHEILNRPHVKSKVVKMLGTADRKTLAKIVFADKIKRKKLERLLHPLIWKEVKKRSKWLTIVEVPLLFEAGWDKKVDAVIVVKCSKKEQLRRCPPEFRNRIPAQMLLSKKIRKADHVIDSNGTKAKTFKQVKNVLAHLH